MGGWPLESIDRSLPSHVSHGNNYQLFDEGELGSSQIPQNPLISDEAKPSFKHEEACPGGEDQLMLCSLCKAALK